MLVAGVVIGVFTDAARGSEDDEAEKGCEGDKKGGEEEVGEEEDEERREGGSGTPVAGIDPKACWTLSPDEN